VRSEAPLFDLPDLFVNFLSFQASVATNELSTVTIGADRQSAQLWTFAEGDVNSLC